MSKGSVLDLIYIGLGLLITSFVVFLVYYLVSQFKAEMPAAGLDTKWADYGLDALSIFNTGFIVITVGAGAAAIIGGFLVKSHPIFFIFIFILNMIIVFLSAQFTNIWYEFVSMDAIASTANQFPYMVLIMQNLPLIELVISAAVAITMYGKAAYFGD